MKKVLILSTLLLGLVGCSKEKEMKPEDYDKGGFVVKAMSEVRVVLYAVNNIGKDSKAMDRTLSSGEVAFSTHHFHYKLQVYCLNKTGCGYTVNGHYFDQSKLFMRGSI